MFPRRVHLPYLNPKICTNFQEAGNFLSRHLQDLGLSYPRDTGPIGIAWPQKGGEHYDKATKPARRLQGLLSRDLIHTVTLDNLYEKNCLDRSSKQGSIHALRARQDYFLKGVPESGKDSFFQKLSSLFPESPFFNIRTARRITDGLYPKYFVLVDDIIDQGTTLANLASWLTANDRVVLAAFSPVVIPGSSSLPQQKSARSLSATFKRAAFNNGRVPDIAEALAGSAQREGLDISEETCLNLLENGLRRQDLALDLLTNGECSRLVEDLELGRISFRDLLFGLGLEEKEIRKVAEEEAREERSGSFLHCAL